MYDIGSHYGWFSIAWICAGGKYVEAFEPSKNNANIMMETILKNKFENQKERITSKHQLRLNPTQE